MKYMFELSGEHPELPLWEAKSLLGCYGSVRFLERDQNTAMFSAKVEPKRFAWRIALSHYVSELMNSVEIGNLESVFEGLKLSDAKSAAIRVRMSESNRKSLDANRLTRELGSIISGRVGIDLENPDTILRVYIGERAHIGRELVQVDRGQYEKRKNRFLPFVSPISIHPRLARALINITSKSGRCSLLDPFCGTGAFLIEASLIGMKTYGSDISRKMVLGSSRNLEHLGLSAILKELDVGEIVKFKKKFDCIVTDPPYGRSATTMREPIEKLYSRALETFSDSLVEKGRLGIVVPDRRMLDFEGDFRLIYETAVRVHRSLTRNFVVLELR